MLNLGTTNSKKLVCIIAKKHFFFLEFHSLKLGVLVIYNYSNDYFNEDIQILLEWHFEVKT